MFGRKPQPTPPPFAPYRPPQPPATIDHAPQLHPAQQQTIDWSEPAAQQPPVRRMPTSYVPAASDLMRAPVTIASPDTHIDAQIIPASVVEARTQGSHVDRANAWLRYSLPLSISMGVLTTIAAVALYDVPLLSWSAMITFGLTFVIAYAAMLFRYWETSPEGVALYHTKELWKLLHSQQRHRQQIERDDWQLRRRMMADNHQDDRRNRRGR
jgi:hypothetical protein